MEEFACYADISGPPVPATLGTAGVESATTGEIVKHRSESTGKKTIRKGLLFLFSLGTAIELHRACHFGLCCFYVTFTKRFLEIAEFNL
jgi:hypothetical protein